MAEKEFDPDEYLAEQDSFNPDEYLAENPDTSATLMQPLQSALAAGANTLSAGYLPQIAGGIKAALTDTPYVESRDQMIDALNQQYERDQLSSLIGSGAGIAAQMAIPTGVVGKGLAGGLKSSASGLAQIGLANPGDVKGEVSPFQLKARYENVSSPISIVASSVPLVASGIGKGIEKSQKIKLPEKLAVKALSPSKKEFTQLLKSEGSKNIETIGRAAIEEGLFKGFLGPSVDDLYFTTKDKLKEYGSEIGQLYSKASKSIENHLFKAPEDAQEYLNKSFNIDTKGKEILDDVNKVLMGSPDKKTAIAKIGDYLDQIKAENTNEVGVFNSPDINNLHKMRQEIQSQITFLKDNKELPDVQRGYKVLLKYIQSGIDNEMNYFDKIVGGSDAKKLREIEGKMSKMYDINSIAARNFAKAETASSGAASTIGATGLGAVTLGMTRDPMKAALAAGAGAVLGPAVQSGAQAVTSRIPKLKVNMAERVINKPGQSQLLQAPVRGYIGSKTMNTEKIEEFPMNMTVEVFPDEIEGFESDINANSRLSNIEKSKRLNLIRKHKRVYIGQ
jgi:hypothetical protein